jgi:hypothetical protein
VFRGFTRSPLQAKCREAATSPARSNSSKRLRR